MATTKISIKEVLNSVWNGITWLGEGMAIVIGYFFFTILFVFFLFNPIVVLIVCLCGSKTMAQIMVANIKDLGFLGDFCYTINQPVIACLPWYAKKHFLMANKLTDCSIKQEVKLFNCANRATKEKMSDWLSGDAKSILWKDADNREILVDKMRKLTDEEFKSLIIDHQIKEAQCYIQKHTISDTKIVLLLESYDKLDADTNQAENIISLLKQIIVKDGLSIKTIDCLYKEFPNLVDRLTVFLNIYAQKQMTLSSQQESSSSSQWSAFLKKTTLCKEAQTLMKLWQYDAFHACGQTLSEETIISFLKERNASWLERIFSNEPNNGLISDRIKAIVARDPFLMTQLWAVKAKVV